MENFEQRRVFGSEGKAVSRGGAVLRGVVTERDVGAIRWICEQGAMTVDQLWSAVWNEAGHSSSPRYSYERVLFLERAGFIEGVRTPYNLKTYFRATKRGYALACGHSQGTPLIPRARPHSNEIPHVDVLTQVRLAVMRSGKCGGWKTDRMLQVDPSFPRTRFEQAIPDAIWTTLAKGRRIAVEYERTRKAQVRLKKKVEVFARELARADRLFDLVLWIGAPGAYQDLAMVLKHHPGQRLRSLQEFLEELKDPQAAGGEVRHG